MKIPVKGVLSKHKHHLISEEFAYKLLFHDYHTE